MKLNKKSSPAVAQKTFLIKVFMPVCQLVWVAALVGTEINKINIGLIVSTATHKESGKKEGQK